MIGQTLGHYRIVEKLGEEQLDFRTDEKAEPDLPLEATDDPVRIYLREMGTVPLLTREGEVEIAKRIERGQNNALKAMSRCPIVIREVQKLGEELKSGARSIKGVVVFNDDELTDERIQERLEEVVWTVEDGSEHTLGEVGQSFAVTRERIRQIEAKALRKLRHPSRIGKLRALLDTRSGPQAAEGSEAIRWNSRRASSNGRQKIRLG